MSTKDEELQTLELSLTSKEVEQLHKLAPRNMDISNCVRHLMEKVSVQVSVFNSDTEREETEKFLSNFKYDRLKDHISIPAKNMLQLYLATCSASIGRNKFYKLMEQNGMYRKSKDNIYVFPGLIYLGEDELIKTLIYENKHDISLEYNIMSAEINDVRDFIFNNYTLTESLQKGKTPFDDVFEEFAFEHNTSLTELQFKTCLSVIGVKGGINKGGLAFLAIE